MVTVVYCESDRVREDTLIKHIMIGSEQTDDKHMRHIPAGSRFTEALDLGGTEHETRRTRQRLTGKDRGRADIP